MKGYPGGHFGHVGMIVYSLMVDDQYNLIGGEQSRKNTERIGSRDWTLSVHRGRGDVDVLVRLRQGLGRREGGRESINTVVGNYNPKA